MDPRENEQPERVVNGCTFETLDENTFGKIGYKHRIFTRDDIEEIINLQPKGNKAKPYQVKQVRNILLKYKLGGPDNDDKV